jgi:hypothetical protein
MNRILFVAFFSLFLSFFPTFAWAQTVEITEEIECFGTTEECQLAIETYILQHPNGGVQDTAMVGGMSSTLVVGSAPSVQSEPVPALVIDEATPDRFNLILLGSSGYLQVGELTGMVNSAGVGFDLKLSERGNIGLQIEFSPAGLLVSSDGARFHASGALNFLAGSERIRGLVGYRAGWISNPTGGSAGQYHHGNMGVQFLIGEAGRWSLTPAFQAGWGASSVASTRTEGRSLGANLAVGVRF